MTATYFFYDLETSGLNPRYDRIMQFAGQRTDLNFKPIGEPYNLLVRLNEDTLPSPQALIVTGITPQKTVEEGYTEAEFAKILLTEVFTADTITVGFNNIRFDDEFIRALFWRNFQDPYEWAWSENRSRWDMLDVVRMTRALRPDGVEWPVVDGKETNRLELITKANGIDHFKAHDALSDVKALIAVTSLIKSKQPKLFEFLQNYRHKRKVMDLVNLESKQPFVYVSGRLPAEFHKATVAMPLTVGRNQNVIVYNLRYDPTPYINMTLAELTKIMNTPWEDRQKEGFVPLPVKELQYNRAPAVAPIGVLERDAGWEKIGLSQKTTDKHRSILLSAPAFAENIRSLYESQPEFAHQNDPEAQLYDGFLSDNDKRSVQRVAAASAAELADLHPEFNDERLPGLLLHYKARNFPKVLAQDEMELWEDWRTTRIRAALPTFVQDLQAMALKHADDDSKQFILQELRLWAESIAPSE